MFLQIIVEVMVEWLITIFARKFTAKDSASNQSDSLPKAETGENLQ